MNIAFVQDCADEAVAARQRTAIAEYARREHIEIDSWVDANLFSPETLSGGVIVKVCKIPVFVQSGSSSDCGRGQ